MVREVAGVTEGDTHSLVKTSVWHRLRLELCAFPVVTCTVPKSKVAVYFFL